MAMKVDELKEELEVRGEAKSGNKAWLRRRLHAAIICVFIEDAMDGEDEPRRKILLFCCTAVVGCTRVERWSRENFYTFTFLWASL
jgi:hypothetical protein